MNLILLSIIFATILRSITSAAAWFLNMRTLRDREKTSPFECGFDPKNNARMPFSLRFFLLGIIFIIFDIEIVLAIPIPLLSNILITTRSLIAASTFIAILLMGLLHEWREGSLNWTWDKTVILRASNL